MRGFEVVVRPVVFPNIRPAPARSLPPQDDPDKGFAVIRGNGAKQVSVTNSWSSSASNSQREETQRRVDETRVYQENEDGSVNKSNYVDIEVANKMWMKGPPKDTAGFNGDDVVPTDPGRGYTGDDIVPKGKDAKANEVQIDYYEPVKEKKNIEIKKKNVIKKAKES